MLYLCARGKGERILDVHAQVPNGALDFRVAEQSRFIMRIPLSH